MLMALERGNVDFVKLLVENGVSVKQFLTTERLEYLYNSCSEKTTPTFKDLLRLSISLSVEGKIKSIKLRHVDSVIKFLMGGEFDSRYGRCASEDSEILPHAFSELFLMAVLCKQFRLAEYFWQQGTHPIIKALVGMKIYSKLAEIAHGQLDIETAALLKSESEKYSGYAYDLLDICYDMNEKQAKKITVRRHSNWSRYSCLSLAVRASHMKFVAHQCCQAHMNDIWVGKLLTRKAYKVLLCCIFPPFLFGIKYKSRKEISSGENEESHFANKNEKKSKKHIFKEGIKKVNYFYTAPIVKFWLNVASYMLFLLAFSALVLTKLHAVPSIYEFFVIMYIISLTIEEFRQMFSEKFRQWINDFWNILDFVAIVCFVIGFTLRLADNTRSTAKVFYSVDVCLWYIRLLDLFSVSSYLGPYVTMIGKMMFDTLRFLCIMGIFTMAYGVATQGILKPDEPEITFDVLKAVVYIPYWQIYGELFLESTYCGGEDEDPCVTGSAIPPLMTAVYLLIANILLLNMLIAIFNNTFTEYQENAEVIWKFERHRLVTEYMKRPVLVPPFMIFAHMWRLFKWTEQKRKKIVPKIFNKEEEEEVADESITLLDRWEEEMIKVYVNKETIRKEQSVEHVIGELSERMLTISVRLGEMDRRLQQLDEIDTKLDSQIRDTNADENNISEHMNALEIKMDTLLEESGKQKEKLVNVQWAMIKLKRSFNTKPVNTRRKSTGAERLPSGDV
ncbi:transient receptor potential cation channel subfamily M member 7-like [Anneissia japonica]|uniref:transient receptor potential cation channel subfamily M member 7-like n=1 Tax=Anneissia japonica TaxID=1529436 RepID=UPI0014257948|nr:transient receptor potential cation channel subfamily M member 7-like [Anneissia japonica]